MNVLWRILGLELLAQLGSRLPARYARLVSVAMLVLANLVPLLGAWQGWMGVGDVFAVYWLENVIVGFFTCVRMLSATGPLLGPSVKSGVQSRVGMAVFFCFHYGLFTFVHGVFTAIIIGFSGTGFVNYRAWGWAALALFLSHLFSLMVHWFGRGERVGVPVSTVMFWPYPRMLVLHVAIIASFFFVMRGLVDGGKGNEFLPVLILVGLKVAVDVFLHLRERARAAAQPAPELAFEETQP